MDADLEASSIECDFGDDCDYAAECCEPNEIEPESEWSKTTVGILLEECLKKKKELHNPRHRRNKFFNEIRYSMLERGFVFNAKTLEKKFHNLKKHFITICRNRERDVTTTKPITWPYYEEMMNIFAEELDIEDAPTMASLYPDLPPKQTPLRSPKSEKQPQVRHYSEEEAELKDSYTGDEESRWVHKSVMAFLDECCKKKQELWDPQIRRRKIFDEIRRRLKEQGYIFYQESLDRKLRNMKKQFQVVNETIQKNKLNSNGKRRRITWPYYEKLKELYGKEVERERKRGMNAHTELQSQSMKSPVRTLKFRPIAPKPGNQTTLTTATDASQSSIIVTMPAIAPNNNFNAAVDTESSLPPPDDSIRQSFAVVSKSHTVAKHDDEKLKFIRQMVALEERRTIVAEQMLAEMIESNKIREKRLEFNRIKLDYTMAKRKRKKNGSI